jgi:hypothetical protein
MRRVVPEDRALEAWFGQPFEDGGRVAVEYWAMLADGSTIAGCHLMRLGSDGLVVEARDYWHLESGHREAPREWGR